MTRNLQANKEVVKQTEKQESSRGELIGQRQTERQDLPLSVQRERRRTASAERMRHSQGWTGREKDKRQQSRD